MKQISLHAIRSATKIIQMRRDIEHNPHEYLSNSPGGVQASASQPPDKIYMSAQARCVFKSERSRKGPLNPVWLIGSAGRSVKNSLRL